MSIQIEEKRGRVIVTFAESIVLHDVMEMMLTSAKAGALGLLFTHTLAIAQAIRR